ncbi:MAG TPA: hypothetical protein VN862_05350 [Candidatus Acidoferrales bacterium]|nr:hypothetical protein [Candidatus Acidoferrales bacterium]
MKRRSIFAILAVFIMAFGIITLPAGSQERSGSTAEAKKMIPLKVELVFQEFEGQNKVASLPYSLYVNANDTNLHGRQSSIRSGLRVPVSVGANSDKNTVQYQDVGTNMDCLAESLDGGLFELQLSVERSWLFASDDNKASTTSSNTIVGAGGDPVIQRFSSFYALVMRDGQTVEASTAANPINGHLMKVLVTLNVAK